MPSADFQSVVGIDKDQCKLTVFSQSALEGTLSDEVDTLLSTVRVIYLDGKDGYQSPSRNSIGSPCSASWKA